MSQLCCPYHWAVNRQGPMTAFITGVTVACYQTTSAFNDPAPRVSEKGPVLPGSLTVGPQHTAKPRKKLNSLGTVPLRPHTGRTGQRSLGARPRASW